MIEAESIRRLAHYDPDTGAFTWLVARGRAKAGSPVGGVWVNKGRHEVTFMGHRCQVARLIWLWVKGSWPEGHVDHKDGNPMNCRWENLRDVPQAINQANRRNVWKGKDGKLLGAHRTKGGRWQAAICIDRNQIHLGLHDTAEEAHAAYVAARARLTPHSPL